MEKVVNDSDMANITLDILIFRITIILMMKFTFIFNQLNNKVRKMITTSWVVNTIPLLLR